jgi:hypothetical protein
MWSDSGEQLARLPGQCVIVAPVDLFLMSNGSQRIWLDNLYVRYASGGNGRGRRAAAALQARLLSSGNRKRCGHTLASACAERAPVATGGALCHTCESRSERGSSHSHNRPVLSWRCHACSAARRVVCGALTPRPLQAGGSRTAASHWRGAARGGARPWGRRGGGARRNSSVRARNRRRGCRQRVDDAHHHAWRGRRHARRPP